MSALLEAVSLSKTFFSEHNALPAVCNVSFSVAPGECLGLAGASGCGFSPPQKHRQLDHAANAELRLY